MITNLAILTRKSQEVDSRDGTASDPPKQASSNRAPIVGRWLPPRSAQCGLASPQPTDFRQG
jgi:hypothetical protein